MVKVIANIMIVVAIAMEIDCDSGYENSYSYHDCDISCQQLAIAAVIFLAAVLVATLISVTFTNRIAIMIVAIMIINIHILR